MKKHIDQVGLIIIGDEILSGRRKDKHFRHVRDYFAPKGVDVSWVYYLGDKKEILVNHFKRVRDSGDVCFTFGGIGATPDDLTRQAVSEAFGVAMVRHPAAVRLIESQFGEEAYPNRILMADLPEGAELIPNSYNNIPGFSLKDMNCLPGFPEMAWPMLDWVVGSCYTVAGRVTKKFSAIIVSGVKESELIPMYRMVYDRFQKVKLSSLPRFPRDGVWRIEIGMHGEADDVLQAEAVVRRELTRLGAAIMDEDPGSGPVDLKSPVE